MAAIGGFIFFGLMSSFLIWSYFEAKKREAEGDILFHSSRTHWIPMGMCIIATVIFFLEMTGLMEPLKAWLQSIE